MMSSRSTIGFPDGGARTVRDGLFRSKLARRDDTPDDLQKGTLADDALARILTSPGTLTTIGFTPFALVCPIKVNKKIASADRRRNSISKSGNTHRCFESNLPLPARANFSGYAYDVLSAINIDLREERLPLAIIDLSKQ